MMSHATEVSRFPCKLCEIDCQNQWELELHMKGKKHRKKMKRGTAGDNFFCEVCNIDCETQCNLHTHMMGSKHAKRMKIILEQAELPTPATGHVVAVVAPAQAPQRIAPVVVSSSGPNANLMYLFPRGIAEQAELPTAAALALAQAPQPAAPATILLTGPSANPLYLFPQGSPNMVSIAPGVGTLDFLRNSQQFQILKAMVKANPQTLQPLLQELGKQNPHLMRLIEEHKADFLCLINEPFEGAAREPQQLASGGPSRCEEPRFREQRHVERDRERSHERGRDRDRDRERSRDRDRDHVCDYDRNKHKSKDCECGRARTRDRDRDRHRDHDRICEHNQDRERDYDRCELTRDHGRSRSKDVDRNRDCECRHECNQDRGRDCDRGELNRDCGSSRSKDVDRNKDCECGCGRTRE